MLSQRQVTEILELTWSTISHKNKLGELITLGYKCLRRSSDEQWEFSWQANPRQEAKMHALLSAILCLSMAVCIIADIEIGERHEGDYIITNRTIFKVSDCFYTEERRIFTLSIFLDCKSTNAWVLITLVFNSLHSYCI